MPQGRTQVLSVTGTTQPPGVAATAFKLLRGGNAPQRCPRVQAGLLPHPSGERH